MRVLFVAVLAFAVVFAAPRSAAAWEGGSGSPNDPDLAALKQAMAEFRSEVVHLRETCAGAKGDAAKDCKQKYAALRQQFHLLKEQALQTVRLIHEWVATQKDQLSQLKQEDDKQQATERDEAAVKSKAAPEWAKWLEDHMLQGKVDLELAVRKADAARAEADKLAGDRHEEALAVAAKWDQRAAQLQSELARFTGERATLVASQKQAELKKSEKKTTKPSVDTAKKNASLVQQLKSLDETIAYKRSKIAELQEHLAYKLAQADATTGAERQSWLDRAAGVREEITHWTGYLNALLAQRKELVAKLESPSAVGTYRDQLTAELTSLDETIAYKSGKIAELRDLLAYKMAKADATTGAEREHWLDLARGVQAELDKYTHYVLELNAQRGALVAKLDALPK